MCIERVAYNFSSEGLRLRTSVAPQPDGFIQRVLDTASAAWQDRKALPCPEGESVDSLWYTSDKQVRINVIWYFQASRLKRSAIERLIALCARLCTNRADISSVRLRQNVSMVRAIRTTF